MTGSVQIIGLPRIFKKIKDVFEDSIFSKALMTEIGLFSMLGIKSRTLQGVDAEGTSFAAYTPKYAVFRRLKGFPIEKVDLTFTGSLLSSMTFDAFKKEVDIYFLNTQDSSGSRNPVKAFFLNQKRNFFALSAQDIDGIMRIVNQYYHRLIEG